MNMNNNYDKIIKNKLSFGNFCLIYQIHSKRTLKIKEDEVHAIHSDSNNQIEIVKSMMDLYYGSKKRKNLLGDFDKALASTVFNSKHNIKGLSQEFDACGRALVKENIKEYLKVNVNDWEGFINDLKELVYTLIIEDDKTFLLKANKKKEQDEFENDCEFVANCLQYIVVNDNLCGLSTVARRKINEVGETYNTIISYDPVEGDPYKLDTNEHSSSTAVKIRLHADFLRKEPYYEFHGYLLYHHFGSLVEFIIEKNLKIVNIEVGVGEFDIYAEESDCFLKQVPYDKKAILKVYDFVMAYNTSFKPKLSWKNNTLAQMCAEGLTEKVWRGYAYYDQDGAIVSYLDYKVRTDGDVELGIALTRSENRKQRFTSSLIYLYELMFPLYTLFSGTYEENTAMIKTFEATGFTPIFHLDKNNQLTNKIRERITPKYLETKKQEDLSNSVYYHNEGLFSRSLEHTRRK